MTTIIVRIYKVHEKHHGSHTSIIESNIFIVQSKEDC